MVVWISCYAFLPVVVVVAYDKIKTMFSKCCKKKIDKKGLDKINKEEVDQLRQKKFEEPKENTIGNDLKAKKE